LERPCPDPTGIDPVAEPAAIEEGSHHVGRREKAGELDGTPFSAAVVDEEVVDNSRSTRV
jgi:hypothetical protein